jgi:hypothetical protein
VDEKGVLRDVTGRRIEREGTAPAEEEKNAQ